MPEPPPTPTSTLRKVARREDERRPTMPLSGRNARPCRCRGGTPDHAAVVAERPTMPQVACAKVRHFAANLPRSHGREPAPEVTLKPMRDGRLDSVRNGANPTPRARLWATMRRCRARVNPRSQGYLTPATARRRL